MDTSRWSLALRRRPAERDPIFVRDGNVFTSAGITAGMDLALELVEEDFGHELALMVARWLVTRHDLAWIGTLAR